MSFLIWNCRGMGSDATVGELCWLVKTFRPTVLFLSETKMWDTQAKNFMWSLGYTGSFAVSCEGRSGGLALFWKQPFSISLRGFNSHCIDVTVSSEGQSPWHATFVYGEPRKEHRHIFWDLIRRLNRKDAAPWICCGDFNEVLLHDEHYGVRDRSDAQIEQFRSCLNDCELFDLGFSGPKFTWTNRQDAQSNIRVRLDRAVANGAFSSRFENYNVENVITTSSDHYAVVISLDSVKLRQQRQHVQQGFKYEAMWKRADDYKEVVESA